MKVYCSMSLIAATRADGGLVHNKISGESLKARDLILWILAYLLTYLKPCKTEFANRILKVEFNKGDLCEGYIPLY